MNDGLQEPCGSGSPLRGDVWRGMTSMTLVAVLRSS